MKVMTQSFRISDDFRLIYHPLDTSRTLCFKLDRLDILCEPGFGKPYGVPIETSQDLLGLKVCHCHYWEFCLSRGKGKIKTLSMFFLTR